MPTPPPRAAGGPGDPYGDGYGDVYVDPVEEAAWSLSAEELETFDVWAYKPAWCQPWTIVATGSGVVATSWVLFHFWPLTVLAAGGIGAWWYIFLIVYPPSVKAYLLEAAAAREAAAADAQR